MSEPLQLPAGAPLAARPSPLVPASAPRSFPLIFAVPDDELADYLGWDAAKKRFLDDTFDALGRIHVAKNRKAEAEKVAEDFRGDADSLRLLESYLDRTQPGWRDDVHADEAERQRAAPGAGGMSTKEAYEILGLEPGASEAEVREAHRRLMKQVHPDRGGSAALAAKINEAKDRVLGKHR